MWADIYATFLNLLILISNLLHELKNILTLNGILLSESDYFSSQEFKKWHYPENRAFPINPSLNTQARARAAGACGNSSNAEVRCQQKQEKKKRALESRRSYLSRQSHDV